MAEMIPDTLPASSTAGEKRVFAALARLPEDCLVYYEPVVRRRYPDLIAILPEVGVLVIEVEDWRLAELGGVTPETVTITRRGSASIVPHPRQQARGYMLRLMDECRRHTHVGLLMQKDGRYAGGYAFAFCHIAVLTNINRSQIEREAPELMRLFPPGTTITRDELTTWDALEPQALMARLKACFDPWWSFPRLTPARLHDAPAQRGRYDAVLIDEAQDWPCSWFRCARLALKEPDSGDLLIVGDGSQSLYRKRDFTWGDAGIQASGRVINKRFDLDRNCRNTAEILRAARAFSARQATGAEGVLALPVEPDTAIRSGPEPWLIRLDDAASEVRPALCRHDASGGHAVDPAFRQLGLCRGVLRRAGYNTPHHSGKARIRTGHTDHP